MTPFDPTRYPAAVAALLNPPRLAELGPGSPNRSAQAALSALTPEAVVPDARDRSMALACLSGLWLYHDFLDESHAISQELHTPEGSYWHAIMHRREPDAGNSKYWWRQVGQHPVFDQLVKDAEELGYWGSKSRWNPAEFVDFCEAERGSGIEREVILRRVQMREMELLLDWCYAEAADR